MTASEMKEFLPLLTEYINKAIDERLGNAAFVKPAKIVSIAPDGLKADIQVLGDDTVLTDVEVYDTRSPSAGDSCHVVYWGQGCNRMNNMAVLFGGNAFR